MRNFHLPLSDEVYQDLRQEALRTGRPATSVARQAIEHWLKARKKTVRHEAIAAFAAEYGGNALDLDFDMEAAFIEQLLATGEGKN